MRNKILLCCKLARFNSPTGYLLVFFPAFYGLILSNYSFDNLSLLLLLFIGSILARGAGCVINDIFDQKFDKQVERTKNRPLSQGALNNKTAIIFLFFLSIICLSILLSLNKTAIYLGLLAVIFIILYPLMKRITNLPQLFLGFTFNFGVLIAYASVTDNLSLSALIMYLACCFWTLGYDTIYAFMDLADDKKIGVKSIAVLLEHRHYKLWLYIFYSLFILLFILANLLSAKQINLIAVVFSAFLLYFQILTLQISDYSNCLTRFKINNYVGAILSFSII